MSVRVIPAAATAVLMTPIENLNPKKQVAAYCRVSTDLEEQEGSYEAQIRHYTDFIESNNEWELAGIYADEGISGTSTKHRERFNAMIKDCEDGKIDMVITKSISRFARNTLDSLKYIRKLKDLRIPVFFEKEGINTMDSSGELLVTIMASIAQQESLSISQNVRMGIQYRFQQGLPKLNYSRFLGYTIVKDKTELQIVPEEAEVIRRIYRDFLDGRTFGEIARSLEADGIKTAAGRDVWQTSSVRRILENEKYMGDLLLQKYLVKDFITHKHIRNDGILPQYYVTDAHEPIVPKAVFGMVQGELLRRERVRIETGKRENHRRDLALNNHMICDKCGSTYRRFTSASGKVTWRCRTRVQKNCDGRIVEEKEVQEAVVEAFSRLPEIREELLFLQEYLPDMDEVKTRLERLETEEENLQSRIDRYAETGEGSDELEEIRRSMGVVKEEKAGLLARKAERDVNYAFIDTLLGVADSIEGKEFQEKEWPDACYEYVDFMERTREKRKPGPVTEYRDEDFERYVDSVIVHGRSLEVLFKAGVSAEVES